jgi:hypothetical protein
MMLFVSACVTAGSDSYCITHTPTFVTASEINTMDAGTLRKILADNEYYAVHCALPSVRTATTSANTPRQ